MAEKSTILIVDDEPVSRFTVEALLKSEGYNLVFAENGREALIKAAEVIPDVMLLDIMMPGMDGFEVCQKLRMDNRLAELPILMVTALDDRQSRLRGIESGADDFMSKPYDREELRARIRTITRLNRYRRLVESEEKLAYLANYDPLTKLPNRQLLIDRTRQTLRRTHGGHGIAILLIDLDGFQLFNDSLGHDKGDELLCEIAKRLNQLVEGEIATAARLSSDEFAILYETTETVHHASLLAQRLLDTIGQQMQIGEQEIVITASVGISIHPTDGNDPLTLLKNANIALTRSKQQGKNTYGFFTSEMNNIALQRMLLESQLRKVITNQELILYYQPQIDLKTNKIIGVEALLRWQHPELGLISPDRFITLAEETGLIIPIGEWVLQTACTQNKHWQNQGIPPLRMSVNVSPRQLQNTNFLQTIQDTLQQTQLSPEWLELELTESMLMTDNNTPNNRETTLNLFTSLRQLGIGIAIDDFGTGYSSLSYLKRFPVNTLKIDKSFIKDLHQSTDDAAITTAIIAMAHNLQLTVIAEGVEYPQQMHFLETHQCDIGQGYLFGYPMPSEKITHYLHQTHPKRS